MIRYCSGLIATTGIALNGEYGISSLPRYEVLELQILPDSPAQGRSIADIDWPTDTIVVAVTQHREIHAARPDLRLHPGERVMVLTPANAHEIDARPTVGSSATQRVYDPEPSAITDDATTADHRPMA
jgi:TrkA-C domain